MIDNTDEKDIELMFAEARRYDLLTAEQEQSIDSTKWSAVREIYALISESDELSQYLAQFCRECLDNPPQIQRFPNRDLHFVLRRELAALFNDGSHADQSRHAAKKLPADGVGSRAGCFAAGGFGAAAAGSFCFFGCLRSRRRPARSTHSHTSSP